MVILFNKLYLKRYFLFSDERNFLTSRRNNLLIGMTLQGSTGILLPGDIMRRCQSLPNIITGLGKPALSTYEPHTMVNSSYIAYEPNTPMELLQSPPMHHWDDTILTSHSVIDHTDAGIKRNHHYLRKRLSLYRKAFSESCLNSDSAPPDKSTLKDANNNILSCLLIFPKKEPPIQTLSYKRIET